MSGLPSDLDYRLKKAAPRSIRQFRTALTPIGGLSSGGINGTDTLKFDIPTGKTGQYLDPSASYLQIRVRAGITGTPPVGSITLDGSAYCLFSRLTIYAGGQIVEDISEYGAFCNAQIDAGVGPTVRQTSNNIMMGTATDSANNANILRGGVVIPTDTTQVFTLPLISGILGAQGTTKYLPIGAIKNELRLKLVLHSSQNSVINTTLAGTGWSITEANLMLSYIELDSEVQNMVSSPTGDEYYISSETWKTFSNSIGAGSTMDSVLIPARNASVKGLIHLFRPTLYQNNFLAASQSTRFNPFFHATNKCNVQYSIGPLLYPNSPITSSPEMFAELQKYFHNFSNSNITGCINSANYNVMPIAPALPVLLATGANDALVTAHFNNTGAGVFGINLDNISNRSDVMTSGVDTTNSNIIANFTYAQVPPSACRLDTFVHMDMIIAIKGGIMTVIV